MKSRIKKKNVRRIALLLSLCMVVVGLVREYRVADAMATPFDLAGALVMELTMYCAGLAAGEKNSDVVQENQFKGNDVTTNSARENYVRECFPEQKFTLDFGWSDTQYQKFVASMVALWANTSYVVTKNFCDKIWDSLPTDGTGALKPEDIVINKEGASILQFPTPSSDPDDSDDEMTEEEKMAEIFHMDSLGINGKTFSGIFSTKAFYDIYRALIKKNADDMEKRLDGSGTVGCDYSVSFWKSNPNILSINSVEVGRTYLLSFNSGGSGFKALDDSLKIYPLSFMHDGVEQIGFASSVQTERISSGLAYKYSRNDGMATKGNTLPLYFEKYAPVIMPDLYNGVASSSNVSGSGIDLQHFLNMYKGRNVLMNGLIWDEYLIDVGTVENFHKFCEYLLSGDYTLQELLNLMKDGWKVEISKGNKEWEGIKSNKKPEELMKKDISGKYREPDSHVSIDSLVKGVESQNPDDIPHGQPLYEFLGDPISIPNPDTNPDANPDANPDSKPDNEAVPDSEKDKYESINPSPEADESWWGESYNPDRDPESDPDVNPNPKPDDPDYPSDGDSSDPEKKPFIPQVGDADGTDWFERFPFCIPYDIYRVIGWFQAERKAPKWNIPFKMKRLNIDESVTIDFTKFDDLIEVIRVFEILTYVAGLVIITRNVIKG